MKTFPVFRGKVAVITGAGSGIGRALAQQLAVSGANLALSDVNQAGLDETVASLAGGVKTTTTVFDVADRAAYQNFVTQVVLDHTHVDIVINNAGIVRLHSIEDGSYEDYQKTFDINIWGVLHGCKEFLPYLRQSSRAWLVNLSSGAGIVGIANYTSYNMSKFAVRGLTESLRNELRDTNVRVCCVHPGGVNTNIVKAGVHSADAQANAQKLASAIEQMSAEQAATIILSGMVKGKKRILVGRDIKMLDIIARLLPTAYDRLVAKYV
jgi:NADP-dependent 3-hydroxy acid dehydrogenase YdfG